MKKILLLSIMILAALVISGCCCMTTDLSTLTGGLSTTATAKPTATPTVKPTVKPTSSMSKIPVLSGGIPGTTFAGKWDTTYGIMTLTVNNNIVTGTYEEGDGMISGTVRGNTLTAVWTELPTRFPPDDAGDLAFTLSSDGSSFTGKWRYGSSGEDWESWDGTRISER
jgi:hypothetical protein